MRMTCAFFLVALAALPAAAQEDALTKEDLVQLAKAGVGDDVIIARIDQARELPKLTADDVVQLKEAGLSEKVIQHLLGKIAPRNIQIRNSSHRAVTISVLTKDRLVNVSRKGGTELRPGESLELFADPGSYRIAIEGKPTIEGVRVPESGACQLTVKGADTAYLDLQTLIAEDADGRRVVILNVEGKGPAAPRPPPGVRGYRHEPAVYGLRGPELSLLPYVSDTVLLGAGVGAIVGHQHGRRTKGALIGAAAGLVVGHLFWGGW